MWLKIVLFFAVTNVITCQILPPSGLRRLRPGPIIQTRSGPIQGQEETYDLFRRIYTYKGIRYAQPPVGNLRFRQALPATPWTETLRAWEYGSECPQFGLVINDRISGEEDCLFLNVATPTNIRSRLPVAVFIHGGGLHVGNAQINLFGPELIIRENIITVGFNYRLGVLGFLNTGDRFSPGNFGIKDMILGLQWVRDNIDFFGGNPNDVTIIGGSGGAVGVNSLVLTPAASGLFHKAIASSGCLFTPWAFNKNPQQNVANLVRDLRLFVTSNEDLVNQLRGVSVESLLRASGGLDPDLIFEEQNFMPSMDPVDSLEPRIFTGPIDDLIRTGNINTVPYIIGYTSAENLFVIPQVREDPTILERFNRNPNLLIPVEWNITPNTPQALEVITAFRNLYFGGAINITADMALQWSDYSSDRDYNFPMSKLARLHRLRQPVYYYRFSYDGALNFFKIALSVTDYPGAVHGDDAMYLYRMNFAVNPVPSSDEAFLIQRRKVRLWSNFIRYGNPTVSALDPLISVTWPMLTEREEFLDIDSTLISDVHPFRQRLDVWHAFDARFNP